MIGVASSDWSRAYDQSRVFRLESGIRSESHPPTGVGHTIRVVSSDRSRAYDRSCAYDWSQGIPTL
jgi:hypothetical protein